MAKKLNPMKWIIPLGAIVLLAVLVHSTIQQTKYHYEVCVTFRGHSQCSTSDAATQAEAIRAAQTSDCQLLTGSRDENMVCLDAPPTTVRQITDK
jgi:hypothetical protein